LTLFHSQFHSSVFLLEVSNKLCYSYFKRRFCRIPIFKKIPYVSLTRIYRSSHVEFRTLASPWFACYTRPLKLWKSRFSSFNHHFWEGCEELWTNFRYSSSGELSIKSVYVGFRFRRAPKSRVFKKMFWYHEIRLMWSLWN